MFRTGAGKVEVNVRPKSGVDPDKVVLSPAATVAVQRNVAGVAGRLRLGYGARGEEVLDAELRHERYASA